MIAVVVFAVPLLGQWDPISSPRPSSPLWRSERSSVLQSLSLSISLANWRGDDHGPNCGNTDPADDPQAAAARDGAAGGQHDLRDGAARRVPAPLCAFAEMRRLGFGRGRGVARVSPIKAYPTCSASGCRSAAHAPRQSEGSSARSGIDGGMRTGVCFSPTTQASTMSTTPASCGAAALDSALL